MAQIRDPALLSCAAQSGGTAGLAHLRGLAQLPTPTSADPEHRRPTSKCRAAHNRPRYLRSARMIATSPTTAAIATSTGASRFSTDCPA